MTEYLPSTSRQRLADVAAALARVQDAKGRRDGSETTAAQRGLQVAVDSARDADVPWSRIGEVLGLNRGNAYQRYRHRADG